MAGSSMRTVVERRVDDELRLEAQRSRELLHRAGVSEDDLSRNGQLYLHVLAESAAILRLRRLGTSDLLAAMSDLEASVDAAESRASGLRTAAAASQRRSRELQRERKDLLNTRTQLDAAADEREQQENTAVMEQRAVEYEQQQSALTNELTALRAEYEDHAALDQKQIEHHAVHALDQECALIERENQALREQLARFHELPLDKHRAASALTDARAELQRLEDEFNARIKQML